MTMIAVSRADYETKLNTMAAAKQLPDTCIMAEPMTIRYAAAGLLADVSDMYKPDESPAEVAGLHLQGQDRGVQLRGRGAPAVLQQEDVRRRKGRLSSGQRGQGLDVEGVRRRLPRSSPRTRTARPRTTPASTRTTSSRYGADFNRLSWMWPVLAVSNGGGVMSPDGQKLLIGTPESHRGPPGHRRPVPQGPRGSFCRGQEQHAQPGRQPPHRQGCHGRLRASGRSAYR